MAGVVSVRRALRSVITLTCAVAGSSALASAPIAGATAPHDLSGISSLAPGALGVCALLSSTALDCWGSGLNGELGNGSHYASEFTGSDVPASVLAPARAGKLSGVASLDAGNGTCAVLRNGHMDCWGYGGDGQLGNGTYETEADVPVAVLAPSGAGLLSGVVAATSNTEGVCARLTTTGVDCWGYHDVGNGTSGASPRPVAVVSTTGTGTLTDVASLASDGFSACTVLTTGGVDCWGANAYGDLGSGTSAGSLIPTPVVATTGTGALSGVRSLTAGSHGYCALLQSGEAVCWGLGFSGQLGNGHVTAPNTGSDVPVVVTTTTRHGALSDVTAIRSDIDGFCALISTGHVECWGDGDAGQLGDGLSYTRGVGGSDVPVTVVALTGPAALGGVTALTSDGESFCARLTTGRVDCWGNGQHGALGNKKYYATGAVGSLRPVAVVGVGGRGDLTGVASVTAFTAGGASPPVGYCALLTSGEATCWGDGQAGQLGDGSFHHATPHGSAIPVVVR